MLDETTLSSISAGGAAAALRVSGKGAIIEGSDYQSARASARSRGSIVQAVIPRVAAELDPALMDKNWIYGGSNENIVATIRQGRLNGMPAYDGRVPYDQIWQVAANVRSLSGQLRKDVAAARNDDMNAHPAESRLPTRRSTMPARRRNRRLGYNRRASAIAALALSTMSFGGKKFRLL